MKKSIVIACILAVFLAIILSCIEKESPPPSKTTAKKPLIIGLIPEQNLFKQIYRYKPLANYLSEHIGTEIELKILPRYGNIVNNFISENMDGAFLGSFTGALAYSKISLEFIARPEYTNGVSTYYGLIFARKDSAIKTARDMKGKRFVFVDKATTAGYLLPLAYFKENSIHDYKTYFKKTYFAGTHEDAIFDVLNREADIGAAKNTIYYKMAAHDRRIRDELKVIYTSPEVPANGLAVRKDLDLAIKEKLRDLLLNMHEDPAADKILKDLNVRKFIKTTIKDYEPVFTYAKKIGLDLANYDYVND